MRRGTFKYRLRCYELVQTAVKDTTSPSPASCLVYNGVVVRVYIPERTRSERAVGVNSVTYQVN